MLLSPLFAVDIQTWMTIGVVLAFLSVIAFGLLLMIIKLYQKVEQGTSIVRNGMGGTRVSFTGMFIIPVLHKAERMDISVKRIEIYRHGEEGLICRDNIRADIKVAFFVRVNKTVESVETVASLLGCQRASEEEALRELFDAKFSEALKTVGKQFDFVELYDQRDSFRDKIINEIGTDLNGYVLDNSHIDYLEQTPLERLNQDNVLDSEGIKKITDLTSREQMSANLIRREKEKVITKQNVEAREAILELQRQQAEAEEKQAREIAEIRARERAQAEVVSQESRQRSEQARIGAEEEIQVSEQNKDRQIIVAQKSKERTDQVETERVEKDRQLEVTERERVVSIAQIEKDKAVEVEKKLIQDVIRERVMVERSVAEEEEKIEDTRAFADADRSKRVKVTSAEEEAQQALVKQVQAAEAAKQAATREAETIVIQAEAERSAAEKETDAKKMLAEAKTAEEAAVGLAEAKVMTTKADAVEKHGTAEATVLERTALAEAKGVEAKAVAEAKGMEAKAVGVQKEGSAEAKVMELKFSADAQGITQKAEAMKLFDGVGREHEEFKLNLNKDLEVELAAINIQRDIAAEQSKLVSEGLKSARIDIVGGENDFFEKVVRSVSSGKAVDRLVHNSTVLTDATQTFFDGNPEYFQDKLQGFVGQFNLASEDLKNLSIAALIGKMMGMTADQAVTTQLQRLLEMANETGVADELASSLTLTAKPTS